MIKIFKITLFIILSCSVFNPFGSGYDYQIKSDVISFVLKKSITNDIVFLGMIHKKPSILQFLAEIIPLLHETGVTHIGLEITTDQQAQIDKFIQTGKRLTDIQIHPQLDRPEYRNLFKVIREINSGKRPVPVALDLPKSKYNESINRDEWMARTIAGVFKSNPNKKMLVIAGNNHVLKKLDWQDHVPHPHRSIREYLSKKRSDLQMFSIGQIDGESVADCDFQEKFGDLEGAVALDLDERFVGWKMGILQSMALKPAEIWEFLDGVIVY